MTPLRRLWCALRGHDPLFAVDAGGAYMTCGSCSYRSPGFDVVPSRRIVHLWRFQKRFGAATWQSSNPVQRLKRAMDSARRAS